jgi:sugar/nucleoside kinase (ribokinase family)
MLVIGSPSIDKIHNNNQTFDTLGGAGLYVSLAAKKYNIEVSLFGPKPDPIPQSLLPFLKKLTSWIGPIISPDEIPRFEISHENNKAKYIISSLGSETNIDMSLLPEDLSIYDCVHITPMGDAEVQNSIVAICKAKGAKVLSMGTALISIRDKPYQVMRSLKISDIAFMNEEEAIYIFGSIDKAKVEPGHILYITLADKGAIIVQGEFKTEVEGFKTNFVDPTGAGETFCGATLANILRGEHPIIAARNGCILAAKKVGNIGPTVTLDTSLPPKIQIDERIKINKDQVEKISAIVKTLPEADPHDFVLPYLPIINHPQALEYFFTVILHQFSFWNDNGSNYTTPLIAEIDGQKLKGSAYLFASYTKKLLTDPSFFTAERQAKVTEQELIEVFRADDGSVPMPAIDLHVQQSIQYGQDLIKLNLNPQKILDKAKNSSKPLKTLTKILDHIGGYKEDPIRKKLNLLILALNQRPEKFFEFGNNEAILPVVDYHCMRACLRTGLIEVIDSKLRDKIENRELIDADEEWAIRFGGYKIQEQVEILSGKNIGAVDWFFFNYTRNHCFEMSEPDCENCAVDSVCAHRKELFQPVLRTTFY